MFVDSHCHLNMLDLSLFDNDLKKALQHAKDLGVSHFLNISVVESDFESLLAISDANPEFSIYMSVGLHPNENPNTKVDIDALKRAVIHPKVIAIGETGLDYYRSEGDLTWQHERFIAQIELSKQYKKPLIIHSRQAKTDTLKILRDHHNNNVGGVIHCFTEDWDMAKQAIDLGFYISFSGIVTFKNAKELQSVAKKCPIDRILIETDAPYLAPIPYRGKPNFPGYVSFIAKYIADLRNDSVENIAYNTTQNFFSLFSLNA